MGKPQEKIKALLQKSGIPYKEIECYGSQIVVTSWCRDSADKWARLLAKFSTVRGVVETCDYAKENKGTCLKPTRIKVYRTFSMIV